jgi:hypothetical protein
MRTVVSTCVISALFWNTRSPCPIRRAIKRNDNHLSRRAALKGEGDGQSSFRLLASEHPENPGEASYAFTCTIRVV